MDSISKIFNLNKTQAELDFVDVTPGQDTPLYIDPYALTTRDDTWSNDAHGLVVSFFEEVLTSIKNEDKPRAIKLLSRLTEPEETHLGVSKEGNRGRGIGGRQAYELYDALSKSKAAQSGLLEDLSDFALFIPNIGKDKISDITTNVIRRSLIDYTQYQCELYGIPMRRVPSGFFWDAPNKDWRQEYLQLPVINDQKLILTPKYSVRYQVGVDHSKYRSQFVLEFLQEEHLRADDSLVTALRDKEGKIRKKVVYKKTVDKHYPKGKSFLESFSIEHPEVIDKYRDSLKESASKIPDINDENFNEMALSRKLSEHLVKIPTGTKTANEYHDFCLSVISFLFYPNLIYPKKEREINEGRKRIDISYTNSKESGLFYRVSVDPHIKANTIIVECKNYTEDLKNPEIDQLAGRFDNNRGRMGMLFFRQAKDMSKVIKLCKDVAKQGNGIILPIDDDFILRCLELIEQGKRKEIDQKIERLYQKVIS